MLGLLKKTILKNKQAAIKKRYPQVNIVLHPDMPEEFKDRLQKKLPEGISLKDVQGNFN